MKQAIVTLTVLTVFALACGLAGAQQADFEGTGSESVCLEVRGASIPQVLESVSASWGESIRLEGEVKGTITLKDTYTSVEQVLDDICNAHPYYWWRDADGTYVLSSETRPGKTAGLRAKNSADADRVTRWVELRFVSPQQLAYMFGFSDSPGSEPMPSASIVQLGGGPTGSQGSLSELSGGRGGGGGGGGRGGGGGGGFGGGGGGGFGGGGGGGFGGGAGGGVSSGVLGNFVPADITDIVAYPMLNALIVQGSEEAVDELIDIIKMLDRKPQQVTVELQSVTVSREVMKQMGIQWWYQAGNFTIRPANFSTAASLTVGYRPRNSDFQATLTYLLQTGGGRVVDAIRITTMNLVPAYNMVTVSYPIVNVGGVAGGPLGGGGVQTLNIGYQNLTTSLTVVPRVNADGTITITIPYVKPVQTGSVPVPIANYGVTQEVPIWTTTRVLTTVNIRDGETFVVAGFVGSQQLEGNLRLPILSDLPILGDLLFTRKTRNLIDSENLLFITAHVIKEEAAPATLGPI